MQPQLKPERWAAVIMAVAEPVARLVLVRLSTPTDSLLIFVINWTLRFGSMNELGLVSGLNTQAICKFWLVADRTQ